jgi:hypothetical protein
VELNAVFWAWGRVALAIACSGALMAARWQHEKQLENAPRTARGWLERRAMEARATGSGASVSERLVRRLPVPSHPLYWLGLTTSAALAAQAIATLLAQAS